MPDSPLAVILAAGAGTRLRPRTEKIPKCLLEVGGRPLLDYQLDALAANSITDVLVVTGHAASLIERRYAGRLRTVHNPDYEATNNLVSLWAARREFAGRDFLCLHADVLFHPALLRPCLDAPLDVCAILDRELLEETMKARVEHGRLVEISKSVPPGQAFGTFLGIARFAPAASRVLPEVLDSMAPDPAHRQAYFTACLPALAARGLRLGFTLTSGLPWIEIDFESDFARATEEILPQLQTPRPTADR